MSIKQTIVAATYSFVVLFTSLAASAQGTDDGLKSMKRIVEDTADESFHDALLNNSTLPRPHHCAK